MYIDYRLRLIEIELRGLGLQADDEIRILKARLELHKIRLELRARGDNWTKDEHGLFTGSTSSGGGSVSLELDLPDEDVIEFDGVLTYGEKDDTINKTVREKIEEWEAKRGTSKIEYAFAVDKNGNILGEAKGNRDFVESPKEWKSSGNTFTHIHPNGQGKFGGTFSLTDLNNFADSRVTTYRAKAKEGTYSISRTDNFDILGFKKYVAQSKKNRESELDKTYNQLLKNRRANKISLNDFGKAYRKAVNSYHVARHNDLLDGQEKYGYKYTLENNGGLKNG